MQRHELRALLIAAGVGVIGVAVVAPLTKGSSPTNAAAATITTVANATGETVDPTLSTVIDPSASTVPGSSVTPEETDPETVSDPSGNEDGCVITERSLRIGSVGDSVTCLQEALTVAGYYSGPVSGTYDQATASAVEALQTAKDLYVDGLAGRETGLALGIWPDEASLVVHTPAPPAGAVDLLGYPMSTVSSAGAAAPPLPEGSGSGRRLVYSRAGQRVWAVGDDGSIIRSWLVSGSKYNNEQPGTHKVYSRSDVTTAWNGKAYLKLMVRWLKTEKGAIGFHSIPIHVADGTVYQTEAELGQRLSGGCQRQAPLDAEFVWAWATIGTPVVVI